MNAPVGLGDVGVRSWRRAGLGFSEARVDYAIANPANRSPTLRFEL